MKGATLIHTQSQFLFNAYAWSSQQSLLFQNGFSTINFTAQFGVALSIKKLNFIS